MKSLGPYTPERLKINFSVTGPNVLPRVLQCHIKTQGIFNGRQPCDEDASLAYLGNIAPQFGRSKEVVSDVLQPSPCPCVAAFVTQIADCIQCLESCAVVLK